MAAVRERERGADSPGDRPRRDVRGVPGLRSDATRTGTETARGLHIGLLVPLASAWLVALVARVDAEFLGPLVAFLTSCPFRAATGVPCPLCGSTTALSRLLALDVSGALAANPLVLGLAAAAAVQTAYRLARVLRPGFSIAEECVADAASAALLLASRLA